MTESLHDERHPQVGESYPNIPDAPTTGALGATSRRRWRAGAAAGIVLGGVLLAGAAVAWWWVPYALLAARPLYCMTEYELTHGAGSLEGPDGFDVVVECLEQNLLGATVSGAPPVCVYDDPSIDPECVNLCDGDMMDRRQLVASYGALESGCSSLLATCDRQLVNARIDGETASLALDCDGLMTRWLWEVDDLGAGPITEEDECMLRALCEAGVTELGMVSTLIESTPLGARVECASRAVAIDRYESLVAGWLAEVAAAVAAVKSSAYWEASNAEPVLVSQLGVIQSGAAPHAHAAAANQASATCELYREAEIDALRDLFLGRTILDAHDGQCGNDYDTSDLRADVAAVRACGAAKGFATDAAAKMQHLDETLEAMDDVDDVFCTAPGLPEVAQVIHIQSGKACADVCGLGELGTAVEGSRLNEFYTSVNDGRGGVLIQRTGETESCAVPEPDGDEIDVAGCGFGVDSLSPVNGLTSNGIGQIVAGFDPWSNPVVTVAGDCSRFDFDDVLAPLYQGQGGGPAGN